MSKIDSNSLFFGNFLDGSSRLCDLEQFREYVEGFLQGERRHLEEEAHPDIEREFLPLFAETFPPILHSSIIISTVILVEQELRGFSNALIEALDLKLKFNDLAGSILEKFRTLVSKVADLQLEQTHVRWDDVVGLFEIRNCLVHAHGQLSEFQRTPTIRAFLKRHGTPECDETTMTIDAKTSQIALNIASDFLENIYSLAIERFPGQYSSLRFRRM